MQALLPDWGALFSLRQDDLRPVESRDIKRDSLNPSGTFKNVKQRSLAAGVLSKARGLSSQLDVYTTGAVVLLFIGFLLRLMLVFPAHRFEGDADSVLAGMCASRIGEGYWPLFFPGSYRVSAQSCYVTAGFFSLFGASRVTLSFASLLFGTLFNVFMYRALREALGPRGSFWGMVAVVLPPVNFLLITYLSWGYTEILMYCAASMWFAAVLVINTRPSRASFFLWGVTVGLALWASIQTLMVLVPLICLLLVRRVFSSVEKVALAFFGILAGGLPLFIFLSMGGHRAYLSSFSLAPVGTAVQLSQNLQYALTYSIPALLTGSGISVSRPTELLQLMAYGAAGAIVAVLLIRVRRNEFAAWHGWAAFCLAIAVTGVLFYALSGAGSIRGDGTTRYALPLYLAFPLAIALIASRSSKAILPTLLLLAFSLGPEIRNYPVLRNEKRIQMELEAQTDDHLIEWLRRHNVSAAVGDYWLTYSLNFHSKDQIAGIPLHPVNDYFGLGQRLDEREGKWAVFDYDAEHLKAWMSRAGLDGRLLTIEPGRHVFLPYPNALDAHPSLFLALVREKAIE